MAKFDALKPIRETLPRQSIGLVEEKPKRAGKRADPDYQQISVYVQKAAYKAARHRLLDSEMDFSDLINQLVTRWLETPTTS